MLTYPGGKNGAGVYQKLINLMPPHERYFEPFLGGGAIMRLKRPARENFGCDLVASQVSAVSAEISSALVSSGAAAGIVTFAERRRSAVPTMADPHGGNGEARSSYAKSGDGIRYRLFRGCGLKVLESTAFTSKDLIYCDPPYLMETRSGRKLYEYEMTEISHRRLLRAIRKIPAMVMISGYWSSLYTSILDPRHGWNSIHFQTMTRGGTMATEWVWFNFPAPVELHDYRYLGDGFRERERIKRKKQRWTARLRRMPTLERQALLCAIAETAESGEGVL